MASFLRERGVMSLGGPYIITTITIATAITKTITSTDIFNIASLLKKGVSNENCLRNVILCPPRVRI
jgi:hypothetical protein